MAKTKKQYYLAVQTSDEEPLNPTLDIYKGKDENKLYKKICQEYFQEDEPQQGYGLELVPIRDLGLYNQNEVLRLLLDWDQTLNPNDYPDSKVFDLESSDFMDAALCKAQELGLEKEFIKLQNKETNWKKDGKNNT